jgi:hypothetical protein
MWNGKKCDIGIDFTDCRIRKFEIGESPDMRVFPGDRGSCKLPGGGAHDLSGRMKEKKPEKLASGISGSPDNRDFHTKILFGEG